MLTYLRIKNYAPLTLKGINDIVLDPIKDFNVLLARNGYGKTSLLREATPLPPDNADYLENGYKCAEYKINGNHYKLESHTGKKSTHYFYLNGENLNKGKTLQVQKELVKFHFGITGEIKNILTGVDKSDLFTSLPPQKRKQILMELNPNDTAYALRTYDKIRSKHNQINGALKHQRQRLVSELRRQEELALIPIDELNYEIKLLDEQIKDALILHGELMHVTDPDISPLTIRLARLVSDLMRESKGIIFPISYWEDIKNRYARKLDNAVFNKKHTELLVTKITGQLNDIAPDAGGDMEGYKQKIDDLDIIISDIDNKYQSILKNIHLNSFFQENDFFKLSVVKELPSIIGHLTNIEVIEDPDMTSSVFVNMVEEEKKISSDIGCLENTLRELRHRLNHYESADNVNCPNCKTGFKPGFETVNPTLLKDGLEKGTINHKHLTEKRNNLATKIANTEGWYYGMLSFIRYIKNTQDADLFNLMIKEFSVGKNHPFKLIKLLENVIECHELKEDLALKEIERKTLVAQYQLLNKDSVKSLYAELDRMNTVLSETQIQIKYYLTTIKECEKNIDIIHSDKLKRDVFLNLFDEIMELLKEKGLHVIKKGVEERVNELTPRKNTLAGKLIRAQSLSSVISDIENQVGILERKEKHLKFLMDSISPTKGLIGHLMLDFLNSLCGNANAVIERIWSDPLKLLSPRIDDDNKDLDYKFGVVTTNPNKPISDIKKCSGGEKEIIDFAIRSTLMRYTKGKTGIPLCLDEIGPMFDELHKRSYSNYIATEKRAGRLPQTFLISHYVTQYGSFTSSDANIIKLNTEGLDVPKDGNENVSINTSS